MRKFVDFLFNHSFLQAPTPTSPAAIPSYRTILSTVPSFFAREEAGGKKGGESAFATFDKEIPENRRELDQVVFFLVSKNKQSAGERTD